MVGKDGLESTEPFLGNLSLVVSQEVSPGWVETHYFPGGGDSSSLTSSGEQDPEPCS